MSDISKTIQPKSDQLNSDDLIVGPQTITVESVSVNPTADQPVSIHWVGGAGRPYKLSKSMRRVIAAAWGVDSSAYVGRSMTLYRDPSVRFGGQEVGGIKISHMTDIEKPLKLALTATRGKKEAHNVQSLTIATERDYLSEGEAAAHQGIDALKTWFESVPKAKRAEFKTILDEKWRGYRDWETRKLS